MTNDFTVDGKAIRRARVLAGYNGRGFAEAVGIKPEWLCAVENNRRRPSPQLLKRMADATGKTVADFVTYDEALAA